MKVIILCLLFVLTGNLYADDRNSFVDLEYEPITALEVSKRFYIDYDPDIESLIDLADKELKVDACVRTYVEKQAKSYAKVVQENLYDLIHNFDKIITKIQGKRPDQDNISYDEKISALARVQCETYYKMGVLK